MVYSAKFAMIFDSAYSKDNAESKQKRTIPSIVRQVVWLHYIGEEFAGSCFCCQQKISVFSFEAGHVVSRNKGGSDEIENLRPICKNCNISMGVKNMDQFIANFGFKTPKNSPSSFNGLAIPFGFMELLKMKKRVPVLQNLRNSCRQQIEEVTEELFPPKIKWHGFCLDGYCDRLKIAFDLERAHHRDDWLQTRIKQFDEQKQKNARKVDTCIRKGVALIVIPHSTENHHEFIRDEVTRIIQLRRYASAKMSDEIAEELYGF